MSLNPQAIAAHMKRLKFAWLDEQMKKHLPAEVYQQAHSTDNSTALGWAKEQGFAVEEDGDTCLLRKGDKILAKARFILELEKPEDLVMLGKSCKVIQHGSA